MTPHRNAVAITRFAHVATHVLTRAAHASTKWRMSDTAPDSLIPYDEIVQEALRAVVGRVLGEVEKGGGLPGDHHFYITFKTQASGVEIPRHLMERFPDEMTIVIQNRFWDLKVKPDGFEVGLSFNQTPSKLIIPFAAITGFVDPAVNFALQFQAQVDDDGQPEVSSAGNDAPTATPIEDGSNVVSIDFTRKK
ncbi:hypothetical protein SAMN05444678_10282 [Sphingomonas sp. YR710]|nr:hypothetical protein SAMN05444678_10282 [Sphingomonas sp. YR710]